MTDVTEKRNILQEEEVRFNSSVSEATLFRMSATSNFISKKQYDTHAFNFNGSYPLAVGVLGADGIFPCLFDLEIVGVTMYNQSAGTSGSTTIDIHYFNSSGVDQGSIFSTRPSMDSSSGSNAFLIRDVLNSATIASPSGSTAPVLSKTNFSAGEALFAEIDSAMPGAENAHLLIHFRPR